MTISFFSRTTMYTAVFALLIAACDNGSTDESNQAL